MDIELSINGFNYCAQFADQDLETLHLPLLQQLTARQKVNSKRLVVFLAAPPGAGKSTLAAFWQYLSQQYQNLHTIQSLPLDGFHFYNNYLEQQQLRKQKGAPNTFDLLSLKHHLAALQNTTTYWPEYDRNLHNPVANAITVTAPIVIIEGNWLLLTEPGWQELIDYSDYTIFIHAKSDDVKQRLINRKMRGGASLEQAEAHFTTTDHANIERVMTHHHQADLTLIMSAQGNYSVLNNSVAC